MADDQDGAVGTMGDLARDGTETRPRKPPFATGTDDQVGGTRVRSENRAHDRVELRDRAALELDRVEEDGCALEASDTG